MYNLSLLTNKVPGLQPNQILMMMLGPATFFALNGSLVFLFRLFELDSKYFLFIPLMSLLVSWKTLRFIETKDTQLSRIQILIFISLPLLATCLHFVYFPLGAGSDAYLYFNSPLHSFHVSDTLSLDNNSFVQFGAQPTSYYFVPNNMEYLFVWLANIFELPNKYVLTVSSFFSLFLLYFIGFLFFSQLKNLNHFILSSILLLVTPYSLLALDILPQGMTNAFFRGFDNKGFIFGYLFICIHLVFYLIATSRVSRLNAYLLVFAISITSIFTSHNYVLFVFISLIYLPFFIVQKNRIGILSATILISACMVFHIYIEIIKTIDVYGVLSPNLEPYPTKQVSDITFNSFSLLMWLLACIGMYFFTKDGRISIQLKYTIYVLVSGLMVHNELFFTLFKTVAPEKSGLFWRLLAVSYPWPLMILLIVNLIEKIQTKIILNLSCAAAVITSFLFYFNFAEVASQKFPFPKYKHYRTYLNFLKENCDHKSKIIASEGLGSLLGFEMPELRLAGNKSYFLNLQIAQLRQDSQEYYEALVVRDAILFLSNPRRKNVTYSVSEDRFIEAIKSFDPQIILVEDEKVSDNIFRKLKPQYDHLELGIHIFHKTCSMS